MRASSIALASLFVLSACGSEDTSCEFVPIDVAPFDGPAVTTTEFGCTPEKGAGCAVI